MGCIRGRTSKSLEEKFPHHNVALIFLLQMMLTTAYILIVPSLYKFITTPSTQPEEVACSTETGKFWPGLGGSDSDYAWVLVAYPTCGFLSAVVAGLLLHRLPFTIIITCFIFIFIVGGIVYALAKSVWTVFAGYGLMGAGGGMCSTTIFTYLGEMGDVMDEVRKRQGKKPRKHILYSVYSFVLTGAYMFPLCVNTIMAQFDITPYHWPGWMLSVMAVIIGIITLTMFTETRSFPKLKNVCPSLRLSFELRTIGSSRKIAAYVFLLFCEQLNSMIYSFFLSLSAPIVSDQFGFSVKYTAYFFLAISIAYIGGSVIQLVVKLAGICNRMALALSLVCVLVGALLFADWQSIGHDPCLKFSSNFTEVDCEMADISGAGSGSRYEAGTNTSVITELIEGCKSLSGPNHNCFWNRKSRITGEYCTECLGTCLSYEKSHNIYQLVIGSLLMAVSSPLGYILISATASDITPLNAQGGVSAMLLAVMFESRIITPLLFIKIYNVTGRHTYPAMAIIAGSALVLLLLMCVLYKSLAPIPKDLVVSATGKLTFDPTEDMPDSSEKERMSQELKEEEGC